MQFNLVYVPSHIFDKPKLHNSNASSSEFAILNNTCADALAGYAAGRVECPPSEVTPVVHHIKLVKAIQMRLYAVTVLHKPRPKSSMPIVTLKPKLSFEEEIALSSHSLVKSGARYLCTKCCASVPCKPFSALLAWTQSLCVALPVEAASLRPIAIGMATVQLGKQVAHPTHSLHLYRGVTFCNKCGCYATRKYVNLANACVAPTTHGTNAKRAINQGRLPPGLTFWPDFPSRARNHVK